MSQQASVRILGAHDVRLIAPILATAFDADYYEAWSVEQIVEALALPNTVLLGCEMHSRHLGFALMRTLLDESELLLIALAGDARRRGLGSLLLTEVINLVREQGARRLFLEVRVNNFAAKFYEHQNFRVIGVRPNYYRKKDGKTVDAQTMAIDIN